MWWTVRGPVPSPAATNRMKSDDFIVLVVGKLDAMKALMAGRIKVSGNLALLMRLRQWFAW